MSADGLARKQRMRARCGGSPLCAELLRQQSVDIFATLLLRCASCSAVWATLPRGERRAEPPCPPLAWQNNALTPHRPALLRRVARRAFEGWGRMLGGWLDIVRLAQGGGADSVITMPLQPAIFDEGGLNANSSGSAAEGCGAVDVPRRPERARATPPRRCKRSHMGCCFCVWVGIVWPWFSYALGLGLVASSQPHLGTGQSWIPPIDFVWRALPCAGLTEDLSPIQVRRGL